MSTPEQLELPFPRTNSITVDIHDDTDGSVRVKVMSATEIPHAEAEQTNAEAVAMAVVQYVLKISKIATELAQAKQSTLNPDTN